LDWLYFLFDFWVLVKCKKLFYILYLVLVFLYILFYILYWLIAWHPPFYLAPFFLFWHPPFIWSVKTNYIFICRPFATAATAAPTAAPLALDPR
jgi:hypothetical protein